jgi:hypothetical protein
VGVSQSGSDCIATDQVVIVSFWRKLLITLIGLCNNGLGSFLSSLHQLTEFEIKDVA